MNKILDNCGLVKEVDYKKFEEWKASLPPLKYSVQGVDDYTFTLTCTDLGIRLRVIRWQDNAELEIAYL